MGQIRKLISALDLRQRITIVIAAVGALAAVLGLMHWHKESDFKPLYSSLAPEDASAVIQKLKESGTEYRVSDNGATVLAPSARIAELRLDLAGAGVPKTGRIGYELFDKTNFGATEFTEHLNYHRALEGELERSIAAISAVEQARVHLTFPRDSVFLDSREPAKASVLLKLRSAARPSQQNVTAIANLIASAVEGLTPEAVSILDMRGNLLNRPQRDAGGDQPSEATLEYRHRIETELLAKINTTLEPLLGAEKFRAGVSVDCDFTSGEQREETLDPTKSVMVTSQKTEEQSGAALASGQPGSASNLPRPTSRPGGGSGGTARRTENISYQSSRLVKHVKLPQGTVKRLSVSVLVDNTLRFEGKGAHMKRVLTPPDPETLKVIHNLVSAVTGFSAERGDQLVVETLPFESTRNGEPPEMPASTGTADPRVPKWLAPFLQGNSILPFAIGGGLVFLVILAGAFLMFRKKPKATTAAALPAPAEASAPAVSSDVVATQMEAQRREQAALEQEKQDADLIAALSIPVATTKKADILIKHFRESIARDATSTTNVIRAWIAEPETRVAVKS